jgi:hypothetical protein
MSLFAVSALACVAVTTVVVGLALLRRRLRGDGGGADVAAAQRRRLVARWSEVERAARRGGMTPEEIAAVRERLLG